MMPAAGPFTNGSFEADYGVDGDGEPGSGLGGRSRGDRWCEGGRVQRWAEGAERGAGAELCDDGRGRLYSSRSSGRGVAGEPGTAAGPGTSRETALLSQSQDGDGPGNGTRYVAQSFAFMANSPTTTVTFRDTSTTTSSVDLMLDNVRVVEAPRRAA